MENHSSYGYSRLGALNWLRWAVMVAIFLMLVALPYISVYQNFLSAHAYDILSPDEKHLYNTMEFLTAPFASKSEDLDAIKGTTWSATLFGLKLSDPLAVVSQIAARFEVYWPFVMTALIPVVLTMVFGRFYCGWLCPANLIYELADKMAAPLRRAGLPVGKKRFDKRFKYLVLVFGIIISAATGAVAMAAIYPPAIVGRELYYYVVSSALGAGAVFFLITVLFDLLVARRGFCRYLCPGGALYSLLGRYRPVRIARKVETCNDCTKCDQACMFDLNPMSDGFGQECNNCTACIAVCPTGALAFTLSLRDGAPQGPGHLGPIYRHAHGPHSGEDPPRDGEKAGVT